MDITLKRVCWTHGIFVFLSSIVVFFWARKDLPSFLAGAGVMTLNFMFIGALWKNILDKKPVATALLIIVFKYAILGALLYLFVRKWNLPLLPFLAGSSTIGGSFVIVALEVMINK